MSANLVFCHFCSLQELEGIEYVREWKSCHSKKGLCSYQKVTAYFFLLSHPYGSKLIYSKQF